MKAAPAESKAAPAESKAAPAESKAAPAAIATGIALAAGVGLLALGVAMRRDYNHDEHQFIAGAALIAREGLLPYRDFAWFHVPTLAYLYALLFRLSDRLLLAVRLFNVAAAAGMAALLWGVGWARLRTPSLGLRRGAATLVALLVIILLIATPAFLHASGRAWNHDLPVLLALAAFVIQVWALERGGRLSVAGSAAAGLLIGLAAGMRLSYAPLALPFLLAPLLRHREGGQARDWGAVAACAGGLALGFLPALLLFARAPDAFLFGNLRYAALNTAWYRQNAGAEAASLGRKLADVARLLAQPGNALLLGVTLLALLRARAGLRAPHLRLWLLLWPFLILGALAPTPVQMQYLYVLFPFLALGIVLALAHDPRPRITIIALAVAALAAAGLAAPRYVEGLAIVADPNEWYPLKAHTRGLDLAQLAASGPAGPVFTLAPALPLEGGASIDSRTATGPFAWRIAPLLSAEERVRYKILGADELATELAATPPRALLTGLHGDDAEAEATQSAWVAAQSYIPVEMAETGTLWLSPVAAWGDRIALAGHTFPTRTLRPGDRFVATLHLQATAPITQNLNILVRAVDAAGGELFRQEGWPYGSPTSTWAPGAVWAHGLEAEAPVEAQDGIYRVEVSFYDPETLAAVGEAQPVAWLHVAQAESQVSSDAVRFADGILLETAGGQRPLDRAEGRAQIALAWSAAARPAHDYTLFVHLVDAAGTLAAQSDRPPLGGFYPTSRWLPGRRMEETVDLPLPSDLAPGLYSVRVGLYDPATQQRLPLLEGGDFVEAERLCLDDGGTPNAGSCP